MLDRMKKFTPERRRPAGSVQTKSYFFAALTFAHRALAAAEILARPAALILRLFLGAAWAAGLIDELKICSSFFSSDWILSLMLAARLNCLAERFAIDELISRSIMSFGLKSQ